MRKTRGTSYLPAWAVLAAALIMCLLGAAGGEAGSVFVKAARICMECIGLG